MQNTMESKGIILLCDTDAELLRITREVLELEGYNVLTCLSERNVDVAKEQDIDGIDVQVSSVQQIANIIQNPRRELKDDALPESVDAVVSAASVAPHPPSMDSTGKCYITSGVALMHQLETRNCDVPVILRLPDMFPPLSHSQLREMVNTNVDTEIADKTSIIKNGEDSTKTLVTELEKIMQAKRGQAETSEGVAASAEKDAFVRETSHDGLIGAAEAREIG